MHRICAFNKFNLADSNHFTHSCQIMSWLVPHLGQCAPHLLLSEAKRKIKKS